MRDNVDSMTARLMQAEEALAQERRDNHQSKASKRHWSKELCKIRLALKQLKHSKNLKTFIMRQQLKNAAMDNNI